MSLAIKENLPNDEENMIEEETTSEWLEDDTEELDELSEDEMEPTPEDERELAVALKEMAAEESADSAWASAAMQKAESVVDIYFLSLRSYRLLDDEEFNHYYGVYERGVLAENQKQLLAEAGQLNEAQAQQLDQQIADGQEAGQAIICGHLRFVVYIAKRYQDMGIDFADLIQEGNEGLMSALPRFEAERGRAFTTYAYFRIRQRITRLIANQSRTIRVPAHPGARLSKLLRTIRDYQTRTGTTPSPEELVREGFSFDEQEKLERLQSLQPISLNVHLSTDDSSSSELGEVVPDLTTISPEQQLELNEIVREIFRCLSLYHRGKHPNRDKQLFLKHLGITGDEFDWEIKKGTTFIVLGEQFGLSRARTQQVVKEVTRHIVKISLRQRDITGSNLLWDLYVLGTAEGINQ